MFVLFKKLQYKVFSYIRVINTLLEKSALEAIRKKGIFLLVAVT
jgi:hypothetical protein